eukprot:g34950.t1
MPSSAFHAPMKRGFLPVANKLQSDLHVRTPEIPKRKVSPVDEMTRDLGVELLMAVAHGRPRYGYYTKDEEHPKVSHENERPFKRQNLGEPKPCPKLKPDEQHVEHVVIVPASSNVLIRTPTAATREISESSQDDSMSLNAKPYPCCFCEASFMSELQRSKHHNAHKKGRLSHVCTQCNVAVSNLNIHMRVHTNTRPFQCPHCDQAFTVSGSLNRHLRTHSGARPYKCPDCPKACSSSSDLKKHLRIHSGERPYKCSLCPKAFTVSGSLKNHLRTHTGERPYQCNQCSQSFTRSGDLKNHVRIHTGDRPYKCSQCPKAFSVSGSLKNHMRTHTGERPYNCDGCVKSFTTSSDLKKHKRSQHCMESLSEPDSPVSPASPVSDSHESHHSASSHCDEVSGDEESNVNSVASSMVTMVYSP